MKYGRLDARRPVGLADLTHYLAKPLPAGPAEVAAPTAAYRMYGNDEHSDCTWAGVFNLRMALAVLHGETEVWPTDEAVVGGYLTMGGGQDNGLVEADVLKEWHVEGLLGDKNLGYAPFNHRNVEELKSVVATFGGAYLGVQVPAPAQDQFQRAVPWDLTGTFADNQIEGGHAIPLIGYNTDHAIVVTWGREQYVTWRWLWRYLDESWAVILSESPLVDLAQLQKDLHTIAA